MYPFTNIYICKYMKREGERMLIAKLVHLINFSKVDKKLASMISSETTFYSEQIYSSRCFGEQSVFS